MFGRRLTNFIITPIFLLALGATIALGQTNTAMVRGTVTDQSKAVIPNATITLVNRSTTVKLSTLTNTSGAFSFDSVPIGTYDIETNASGFGSQSRSDLQLSAGQVLQIDLSLSLSVSKQSVNVSAAIPLVDTATAKQALTFVARDVAETPIANRDWSQLLTLDNGVSIGGIGVGQAVSLNGLPPAGFRFTIDGTGASSNPEVPIIGFFEGFNVINNLGADAISEITVTKGITPASVAGTLSGNLNIVTKSGTNEFHGDLLERNEVSATDARNQFLSSKAPLTFNQFGATLGGPILLNKLFFFGSYEGVRESAFQEVSDNEPTAAFRAQAEAAVPQYAAIFKYLPLPNQPTNPNSNTGRYIGTGSLAQKDENGVFRLDDYLNSTNILSARFTISVPYRIEPSSIAVNARTTLAHNHVYTANYTHIAPSWTTVTSFGYNRMTEDRLDGGFALTSNPLDGLTQLEGGIGFNTQGSENYQLHGSTTTLSQNFTRLIRRHSIQIGGFFERDNAGRTDATTPTISYSTIQNFLANSPDQIAINYPLNAFQLHNFQLGGFIQDDIRASEHLTLNLGLRYDYFSVPQATDDRVFNRNGPFGFGDLRPADSMYDASYLNFGPRVGIAYSPGADHKTVIRAGGGIFFNGHPIYGGPIETILDTASVPFRQYVSRAQAQQMGLTFPIDTLALLKQTENGEPIYNTSVNSHFPNPYSMQWTAGVERELPSKLLLDVTYIGNHAIHLNLTRQENLPDRITGISPLPSVGSFRYYDSSDASNYEALQVALQKRFANNLSFMIHYTYANNLSYSDGDLVKSQNPQDNNNIRADYGPTPFDIRHSFTAQWVYQLPFYSLLKLHSGWARELVDGWQVSGTLNATTGSPQNIGQSTSYPGSRPNAVAGVNPIFDNYQSTLQYLNPAAYSLVPIVEASGAGITPGNVGRYSVFGPGQWTVNFSAAKSFKITERIRFQLRGEFFNFFNHTNLGGLDTDVTDDNFGQLTSATARTVQFQGKLVF